MISILYFLMTGFWLWALYDCIQNEPDKQLWIWILIFTNFAGACIYFLTRVSSRSSIPIPKYFARWTRQRELWTAEVEARNIGKAHQFVNLGNLLCDLGMYDRAEIAFGQALEKEANNQQALWGVASVAMYYKKFDLAKNYLQKLLQLAPDYKYGDASLAYCKTLLALAETEAAQLELKQHVKTWGQPEAYILLAKSLIQQNNTQEARNYLETIITRVKGSTHFHYKRNRRFIRQAEKMLREIGHN